MCNAFCDCGAAKMTARDDRLFAGAILVVVHSKCYDMVKQSKEAVVSALCVLAAWGRSDVVRRLTDSALARAAEGGASMVQEDPEGLIRLVERQPFMRASWQPDPNDNEPVPRAVQALLIPWKKKPWHTFRGFLREAERFCIEAGTTGFRVMPATVRRIGFSRSTVPSYVAEAGAHVADLVPTAACPIAPKIAVHQLPA